MTHWTEDVIERPGAVISGAIGSVVTVIAVVLSNPIDALTSILSVFAGSATELFTAASIAGFTLAPEIPSLPEGSLQALALFFGIIVIAKILNSVWDAIKERLTE